MDKMVFFLIFWKMTEIYHQNSMDSPIFMEFITKYLEDDSSIYHQNYIYIWNLWNDLIKIGFQQDLTLMQLGYQPFA